MRRATRSRAAVAVGMALLAVVAVASPAGAFYAREETGTTGSYQFTEPAARCLFENNGGQLDDELDKMRLLKFLVHGPYASDTKIRVRVQVWRNTPPHSDGVFQKYAVLPWTTKHGDENEDPAYFGPYTYTVPEDTTSQWRFRVLINFYGMDGTTIVGRVRGLVEVYRHKHATDGEYDIGIETGTDSDLGFCREEFH